MSGERAVALKRAAMSAPCDNLNFVELKFCGHINRYIYIYINLYDVVVKHLRLMLYNLSEFCPIGGELTFDWQLQRGWWNYWLLGRV